MTQAKDSEQSNIFTDMVRDLDQSGHKHSEWAKIQIADQISAAMRRENINKADLSRRLGKSRAYVTQILQGNANFTVESLVKVSRALHCLLEMKMVPQYSKEQWVHSKRKQLENRILAWPGDGTPPAPGLQTGMDLKDPNGLAA